MQDPHKEVMNLRNLFPDEVALHLDEHRRSTWCWRRKRGSAALWRT
jgi:hypothetical protein